MVKNHQYNVDKMYTYIRGYLRGAKMEESLRALQYMRQKHAGQTRKNGVPYIVHPLSMACYIAALNVRDDNLMAVVLMHDVVEDCNVDLDTMPFNDIIKRGIKYMTVTKLSDDEDKVVTKKRYYKELLNSPEAIICKALDRYNNLTDMSFALSEDAIAKNCAETQLLLLPVLKEAKEKWAELSDLLFILRTNIIGINDNLILVHEELYNKWCKEYGGE